MNEDRLEDVKRVTSIFPEAVNLNSMQIGNRPSQGLRQAEESALADSQRPKAFRDVGAKVQHMHEKFDAWAMAMLSKGLDGSFREPAPRRYLNWESHKMIQKNGKGNTAEAATKDKGNVLPHGHRPQETVYEPINVMRQMIEQALSKPEQSDVLDSIWSDDEEQDQFNTDSEFENT